MNSQLLYTEIANCLISSSMSEKQIDRLKKLNAIQKTLRTEEMAKEKESLKKMWNSERIQFGPPFELWLDWWNDDQSGGSELKTWAGLQFVLDIVRSLHQTMKMPAWQKLNAAAWLSQPHNDGSLPLYFDSDIGTVSSSIDVGFSLDELKLRSSIRPLLELLAFVGLQRFRPKTIRSKEHYRYTLWFTPHQVTVASAICSGGVEVTKSKAYDYRLLYRTDYLKCFLPAIAFSTSGV